MARRPFFTIFGALGISIVCTFLCGTDFAGGYAIGADIWLAGVDPYVRHAMKADDPSDYMALFVPNAPWQQAAADVRVWKTSTQWIMNAKDGELTQMFDDLRRRHITLAMETLMLTPPRTDCGNVEGYSATGTVASAVKRIAALKGELGYIAMDEPLWFGHHYTGAGACKSSVADLARDVAEKLKTVRQIFPKVQVGDIEPISVLGGPDWSRQILDWAAAYKVATGEPLAFFHADVAWDENVAETLPALARDLHSQGVAFGIIYNGEPRDRTDLDWTLHAEERFDTVEAAGRFVPEQAILQTWMLHPERFLPESQPGTMTYLVRRYARTRTKIAAHLDGAQLEGRLTDVAGKPVAHVTMSALAVQDAHSGQLTPHVVSSVVPPLAVRAVIGLRLNTECNCKGTGTMGFGLMEYSEDDKALARWKVPIPTGDAGKTFHIDNNVTEVEITADRAANLASVPFAVVPGRRFRLTVPLRASTSASKTGYVAIIFLNQAGHEIERDQVVLDPGLLEVAAPKTDGEGRVTFVLPGNVRADTLRLEFAGDSTWRKADYINIRN